MINFTLWLNISFTSALALTVISLSLVTSYFYQSATTEGGVELQQNQIYTNTGLASNI